LQLLAHPLTEQRIQGAWLALDLAGGAMDWATPTLGSAAGARTLSAEQRCRGVLSFVQGMAALLPIFAFAWLDSRRWQRQQVRQQEQQQQASLHQQQAHTPSGAAQEAGLHRVGSAVPKRGPWQHLDHALHVACYAGGSTWVGAGCYLWAVLAILWAACRVAAL